ncbi:MAG: OmpA family protein [Acidobacteriota bacterium]
MRRAVVAALVILAWGGVPEMSRAQMRAHSWEVSPNAGGFNGSQDLQDGTASIAGLRVGYNLNRWWEIELGYSFISNAPTTQTVGQELTLSGNGVMVTPALLDFKGTADSDVSALDLNFTVTAHAHRRRWFPFGTIGVGNVNIDGRPTQGQLDKIFPNGPDKIDDTFDFDMDGNLVEDRFRCSSCGIIFLDPNDPNSRRFVPGGDLESFNATQWNIGGGVRILLTDSMSVRVDLRQVFGGTKNYSLQVLTAGLSFHFGGEPPLDDDGDGVPSFRDHCPETPKGATVDARGCPSDSDGDKILDGLDACPQTPEGWPVDGTGCPTDGDGDGVPDGREKCPETPAGAVVDADGCAVDSDGDEVPDGIDQCENTPAGAVVDAKGCPVDSDKDGVPDGLDQCDNTPEGLTVDPAGCPIDSDGDGLKDDVDQCREFAGPGGIDEEGCPRFRLDKMTHLTLPGVTFASGSSTLTDEAQGDLESLLAALRFYSRKTIQVDGHTDNIGSERDNFLVSLDRARAVKRFLVEAGIDAARIETRGYGEIRPVGDNNTAEGRRQNRRIEVVVTGELEEPGADGEGDAATPATTGEDGTGGPSGA